MEDSLWIFHATLGALFVAGVREAIEKAGATSRKDKAFVSLPEVSLTKKKETGSRVMSRSLRLRSLTKRLTSVQGSSQFGGLQNLALR